MKLVEKIYKVYEDILRKNQSILDYIIDNYLLKLGYRNKEQAILYLADNLTTLSLFIAQDDYFNKEASDNMVRAFTQEEFEVAFDLALYEWEYAFIAITLKSKDDKSTSRQLLIPYRNSLADAMYGMLAALDSDGKYLLSLTKGKDYKYVTKLEQDSNSLIADEFFSFELLYMNNATLRYDYDSNWTYSITLRKSKYITGFDHYNNVIVESAKGIGIIEDNKELYLKYINGYYDEGLDAISKGFNLEDLNNRAESNYLSIKDNYDFSLMETNSSSENMIS